MPPPPQVRGFFATPLIVVIVLLPVSLVGSAMSQMQDAFCGPANKTAVRWDAYCRSDSLRVLKAVVTGFVPALLINLWQVGGRRRGRERDLLASWLDTRQ